MGLASSKVIVFLGHLVVQKKIFETDKKEYTDVSYVLSKNKFWILTCVYKVRQMINQNYNSAVFGILDS